MKLACLVSLAVAASAMPFPSGDGVYDPAIYDPTLISGDMHDPSIDMYGSGVYDPAIDMYGSGVYDPAVYDPALIDPAAYDPTLIDPAAYDPTLIDPAVPLPVYKRTVPGADLYSGGLYSADLYSGDLGSGTYDASGDLPNYKRMVSGDVDMATYDAIPGGTYEDIYDDSVLAYDPALIDDYDPALIDAGVYDDGVYKRALN